MAIEGLSHAHATLDKEAIPGRGFGNSRAASDKYRRLLSALGIPLEIPPAMSAMTKLAARFDWKDAPHALTKVRNALVHPEQRLEGHVGEVIFDAWRLGLWHLELTILRLCGYSGTYSNRLVPGWVGQVEPVPWDETPPSAEAPASKPEKEPTA